MPMANRTSNAEVHADFQEQAHDKRFYIYVAPHALGACASNWCAALCSKFKKIILFLCI